MLHIKSLFHCINSQQIGFIINEIGKEKYRFCLAKILVKIWRWFTYIRKLAYVSPKQVNFLQSKLAAMHKLQPEIEYIDIIEDPRLEEKTVFQKLKLVC